MEKMNYDYEIRPDLRKFRLSSAEKERATAALLEHHYNNKVWKLGLLVYNDGNFSSKAIVGGMVDSWSDYKEGREFTIEDYKSAYEAYITELMARSGTPKTYTTDNKPEDITGFGGEVFQWSSVADAYFTYPSTHLNLTSIKFFVDTEMYKGPGKYEFHCSDGRIVYMLVGKDGRPQT